MDNGTGGLSLRDRERLASLDATGLSATADETFDRYAQMVRTYLGVPVALVSLVDDSRQFFPGMVGLEGSVAQARETPLTHSFCQHVVLTEEPVVTEDARDDHRLATNLAIPDLGVIGYAGMPLTDSDGRVLGSLCAIDTQPHAWTAWELGFLSDLAKSCSAELRLRSLARSLETARAAAEVARRRAEITTSRLAVLSEASRILTSSLDGRVTLSRLLGLMVPRLADWALVAEVTPTGEFGSVQGLHRSTEMSATVAEAVELLRTGTSDRSLVRQVARSGEAVFVPRVDASYLARATFDGALRGVVERMGIASLVAVPLLGRGGLLGVLVLGNGAGAHEFDQTDLNAVGDIGRRAGLALENARLFGRQSRAADVLQRSLLTPMPEPNHLHLVARYIPAASEAQVGGDWYDAFLQPEGGTVIVIGDVVGHDIAAAAAMSQLRTLVRGMAYDRGSSPADLLARVDAAMTGLGVETLATVVIARIEQPVPGGPRTLRWSNAGHPPPLLLLLDGSVQVIDETADLMLGVDHRTERHDHTCELPFGSTLLLYTDGLVERRGTDIAEGISQVQEAMAEFATLDLDRFCDSVIAAVAPEVGEDDVALLAVRAFSESVPRPREAGPRRFQYDRPSV